MGPGKGLKRHTFGVVVQAGGSNQTETAHLEQVIPVFAAALGVMAGNRLHQPQVLFHPPIALLG